jgi:Domain of unknown function (DUF1707)
MDDRLQLRASDQDRQQVVDRLRGALADGRLTMDEYVERMGLAYQATTYGDLAPLCADLPAGPAGVTSPAGAAGRVGTATAASGREGPAAAPGSAARRPGWATLAALPAVLKVLWVKWLVAVSVNVVVWILVSSTSGHLAYPWPLWVAGPFGALLFALSVGAILLQRDRPSGARPLTLENG